MTPEELIAMNLPTDSVWLPTAASTIAAEAVDKPYYLIYYTCVVTFFLIIIPMFYFMVRYKRRSPDQKAESQEDHSQLIEIIWSAVPLIFFVIIFVWGFRGYMMLQVEPADSMPVYVRGYQWGWELTYVEDADRNVLSESAKITGRETFVVPAGRPVKLIMHSSDVLHSFFIPNFRQKNDVIPGRYSTVWFEVPMEHAAKPPSKKVEFPEGVTSPGERIMYETLQWEGGEYPIFCTEYCGKDHSRMLAKFKVVPQEQYNKWVKAAGSPGGPSIKRGQKIYANVCMACHSIDGSRIVGPTFKGLYGKKGKTADGADYVADDSYIKQSVLEPNRIIVNGYPPAMPAQNLSEDELTSVIMYIKSLSGEGGATPTDDAKPTDGAAPTDAAPTDAAPADAAPADAAPADAAPADDGAKAEAPSAAGGETIYKQVCIACHSINGTRLVGPTMKGMYGKKTKGSKGEEYVLDDAGIKNAILNPNANIAGGDPPYPPAMVLPRKLSDSEIDSVILYLKTLK